MTLKIEISSFSCAFSESFVSLAAGADCCGGRLSLCLARSPTHRDGEDDDRKPSPGNP